MERDGSVSRERRTGEARDETSRLRAITHGHNMSDRLLRTDKPSVTLYHQEGLQAPSCIYFERIDVGTARRKRYNIEGNRTYKLIASSAWDESKRLVSQTQK